VNLESVISDDRMEMTVLAEEKIPPEWDDGVVIMPISSLRALRFAVIAVVFLLALSATVLLGIQISAVTIAVSVVNLVLGFVLLGRVP
jgi:hypothetical protein